MEKQEVLRSIAKYGSLQEQSLASQNLSRIVLSAENPQRNRQPEPSCTVKRRIIKEDCDHESLNFFGIGDAAALLL